MKKQSHQTDTSEAADKQQQLSAALKPTLHSDWLSLLMLRSDWLD